MDFPVPVAAGLLRAVLDVPPSKSLHQRMLVLDHLSDVPVRFAEPSQRPQAGSDVRHLAHALTLLGRWEGTHLGVSRESRTLRFGLGATGLRFGMALAPLRPAGARTLLGGQGALLARPHGPLLHALRGLGARIKRRASGRLRILGGGLQGGSVSLDASRSSQFASALLLVAPRIGGLTLRLCGRPASLPYLRLTLAALARFGVPFEADGLEGERGRITVAAAVPRADTVRLEADASAASAWWAAALLRGGSVAVRGLSRDSPQADAALLPMLERLGARLDEPEVGVVRVSAPGGALTALGDVDLRDCPDLIFLVGVLAARATGETRIHGVTHTRGKESDRIAVLGQGLEALGARVFVGPDDVVHVRGGSLHGGSVAVRGDHRVAFAFGVLGLAVPGVILQGAQAVSKSHPTFLDDLATLARDPSAGSA